MGRDVQLPNLPGLVAVFFSAVPAMFLVYVLLHRYDRFFSERRLLMALLVGLMAGAAVTLVEIVFLRFHEPAFLLSQGWQAGILLLIVFYPLLETMGKFVPLNWHSYRGKRDTPYYAVGIGMGFAAINAFILVGRGVVEFESVLPQLTHFDIAVIGVVVFVLLMGGIMTHGFSTVLMGQAIADQDPWRAVLYGVALLMPYYVGYWAMATILGNPLLAFAVTMAVFTYGAVGIWWVRKNILDNVVPPNMARQLRRQMDKEDLEKKAEDDASP